MKCVKSECRNEAIEESSYCSEHQWSATSSPRYMVNNSKHGYEKGKSEGEADTAYRRGSGGLFGKLTDVITGNAGNRTAEYDKNAASYDEGYTNADRSKSDGIFGLNDGDINEKDDEPGEDNQSESDNSDSEK
jgi:hypothetical protein